MVGQDSPRRQTRYQEKLQSMPPVEQKEARKRQIEEDEKASAKKQKQEVATAARKLAATELALQKTPQQTLAQTRAQQLEKKQRDDKKAAIDDVLFHARLKADKKFKEKQNEEAEDDNNNNPSEETDDDEDKETNQNLDQDQKKTPDKQNPKNDDDDGNLDDNLNTNPIQNLDQDRKETPAEQNLKETSDEDDDETSSAAQTSGTDSTALDLKHLNPADNDDDRNVEVPDLKNLNEADNDEDGNLKETSDEDDDETSSAAQTSGSETPAVTFKAITADLAKLRGKEEKKPRAKKKSIKKPRAKKKSQSEKTNSDYSDSDTGGTKKKAIKKPRAKKKSQSEKTDSNYSDSDTSGIKKKSIKKPRAKKKSQSEKTDSEYSNSDTSGTKKKSNKKPKEKKKSQSEDTESEFNTESEFSEGGYDLVATLVTTTTGTRKHGARLKEAERLSQFAGKNQPIAILPTERNKPATRNHRNIVLQKASLPSSDSSDATPPPKKRTSKKVYERHPRVIPRDTINPKYMYPGAGEREVDHQKWWKHEDGTNAVEAVSDYFLADDVDDQAVLTPAEFDVKFGVIPDNMLPKKQTFTEIVEAAINMFEKNRQIVENNFAAKLERKTEKDKRVMEGINPTQSDKELSTTEDEVDDDTLQPKKKKKKKVVFQNLTEQDTLTLCCMLDRARTIAFKQIPENKKLLRYRVDDGYQLPKDTTLAEFASRYHDREPETSTVEITCYKDWLKDYLEYFQNNAFESLISRMEGAIAIQLPNAIAGKDIESYEQQGKKVRMQDMLYVPATHKPVSTLSNFGVVDAQGNMVKAY
jgi:hypothetical protein